jgi:hypothetical protein
VTPPPNHSKHPGGQVLSHPLARANLFSFLYGALLGLALLKFGNPVILDRLIAKPADIWQAIFSPWPLVWGQIALVMVGVLGWTVARFEIPRPRWLIALPLAWFGWQLFASTHSIDSRLSQITIVHFGTCLVCLALGLFALGRPGGMNWFFAGLIPFFFWMAWLGFDQHYGGLDATERMIRETPGWQQLYPPEYLERIAKKRIFATLVYPNALAGVVLLLLPPLLVAAWNLSARLATVSRMLIVGLLGYMALACLVWSGSKSGWLIALALLFVAVLHRPIPRRLKMGLLSAVCVIGLFGFAAKFAPYFRKGATSVGARFQYWRAATVTAAEHPMVGTGPGTFARAYSKIKPPDAEMAQLVHNDYLEQASDSGAVGFLSYAGFWFGSMALLYRRVVAPNPASPAFAVWLGLLGWLIQGLAEFGLYVPALAWPAFTLIGWLWGKTGGGKTDRQAT